LANTTGKGDLNTFIEGITDGLADILAAKVMAKITIPQREGAAAVPPRLLTVEQAATYLGRTVDAVQHMVAARRLPTVRDGRRVFLDIRQLDQWITQNTERAEN
jgi:excisionase family DNA binding protein